MILEPVNLKNFLPGRNRNEKVVGLDGETVFRKSLSGDPHDARRRFENLLAWDEMRRANGSISSPAVIKAERETFTIDSEWVESNPAFQDILFSNRGSERAAYLNEIVDIVAKVHDVRPLETDAQVLAPSRGIGVVFGIDLKTFALASGGELEILGLFHSDSLLFDSVKNLYDIRQGQSNRLVISHGDLRIDQFLLSEERELSIVDFEELCWSHPEFDLGNLFASLVFSNIYKVLTVDLKDASSASEIDNFFLENGSKVLDEVLSEVGELTARYTKTAGRSLNWDLLSLELGWSILERVVSRSKLSASLATVDRAIAGIARTMLVQPSLVKEIMRGKVEK